MKAKVDADLCTCCGLCWSICPEVFEAGDDNVTVVKVDPVPAECEDAVKEAAESCPESAISIS